MRRFRLLRPLPRWLLLFILIVSAVSADETRPWSLSAGPGVEAPLGNGASVFGLGVGVRAGLVRNRGPFGTAPGLWLDYTLQPVGEYSISNLSAALDLALPFRLSDAIRLSPYLAGGVFFSFFNQRSELEAAFPDDTFAGIGPWAAGGLRLGWTFPKGYTAVLDLGYRGRFGLSHGLGLGVGVSYGLRDRRGSALPQGMRLQPLSTVSFRDIRLDPVFPVFYKHYDQNPVGTATLVNSGKQEITDIKVSLFSRQFMDDPKTCSGPRTLAPAASAEYSLLALFNPLVLELSERTKASVVLAVEFSSGGIRYRNEYVESLGFEDRNATVWDDDRKAAAFVSVKDPDVLTWARRASEASETPGSAVDRNLAAAVAAFEILRLASFRYSVDPTTPYREFSTRSGAVDYLQFPRQTLRLRSGDCDDLTVLYAALLESVGVGTAFVTVPGHIYTAVALDTTPAGMRKTFRSTSDFLEASGRAWVPVEVTALDLGFDEAWHLGARQWREQGAAGKARLWPVAQAWELYEPVGLARGEPVPEPPSADKVRAAASEVWRRLLEREYRPQVAGLEKAALSGGPKGYNALGILHARYGFLEEAEKAFQAAIKAEAYPPALVNLGNLALLRGRVEEAYRHYDRAAASAPKNPAALLGLARASQLLENYGTARRAFDQLKAVDPALASRYEYLAQAGQENARAAEAQRARRVDTWSE
ncbi:MAG TPA: hypothetical protein P5313_01390 [Spirochaetia bacterium]|nr:hypothetical protein [Spirochaetales bacterium]HRY79046.1 hypothetical protein [Spirochaetia bacterium]